MTIAELTLTPGFAVLSEPRFLSVFRLVDGSQVYSWSRQPDESSETEANEDDDRAGNGAADDDGADDDGADHLALTELVVSFALDARQPRLALLWRDRLDLVDLESGATRRIDVASAQYDSLIAVGPDGSLFAEGEATGLAAIFAFAQDDELSVLLREVAPPDQRFKVFHPRAGQLSFALGFSTLPHVQQLVFSDTGRHALTGTLSQYRAHLAYISVERPGELVHAKQLEVIRIAPLAGFRQAVVHEASYAGSKRLSLWNITEDIVEARKLERVRDLHVEYGASSITIQDFVVDPDGGRVIVLTTDGRVRSVEIATGSSTHMQRIDAPVSDPITGAIAVDFARGLIAIRGPASLDMFKLETGAQVATLDPVDGIYVHRSRFVAITAGHVDGIDAIDGIDGINGTKRERLADVGSRIVAACPSPEGLVVVNADRRSVCVSVAPAAGLG